MKKTKFTEAQIVFAVKQAESGVKVPEVRRVLTCEVNVPGEINRLHTVWKA